MAKLDPIVSEFDTTEQAEAYDAWFRRKVQKSLDDPRPPIPHDDAVARLDAVLARTKGKGKAA
jgi:hypothetical protein